MRPHTFCFAFASSSSLARSWSHSYAVLAFQQHQSQRHLHLSSRHLGIMNADETNIAAASSSELEIEKKFSISDAKRLEETLTSLGFKITRREEFADWYFDLPPPHWHFSLNDCWFRYREKKIKIMNNWGWKGAWQVKRGNKEDNDVHDGMTVYEELQGKAAKELILQMLSDLENGNTSDGTSISDNPPSAAFDSPYKGHDVPYLAGAERLVPFARLETFRTCWESANKDCEFGTLKVDIDKTSFGYQVGEVEAVLDKTNDDKSKVDAAKEEICKLVELISSDSQSDPSMVAIGKLEYYLINNHRDHYDACVASGVIGDVN